MPQFPVVHRQWDVIQPLKAQITNHALAFVCNVQEGLDKDLMDVLVCLMLLNQQSPLEVFEVILNHRQKLLFAEFQDQSSVAGLWW